MFIKSFVFNLLIFALICDKAYSDNNNEKIKAITNGIMKTLDEVDREAGLLSKITDFLINRLHVPGTKWCGSGNLSTSLNDLGYDKQTDICCRNHDLCPLSIKSGDRRFGLYNDGNFYRSHCSCDKDFYKCLKGNNHYLAQLTGQLYFNVLSPPCFQLDYPIIDCDKINGKCVDYKLDKNKSRIYQWFENPIF